MGLETTLPIEAHLGAIRAHLNRHASLVLIAEPGAGKTTRVPPALLDLPGQILVLEPRRLAARLAATRVAKERGSRIGDEVGYQFRFERVMNNKTRLVFLTEGMLMRWMLDDPKLEKVSAVVLDEFHERHLHGDVALAALRRLQLSTRPDLKLMVMSATLDAESIASYLGDAPVVRVSGKIFEVRVEYAETLARDLYLEKKVAYGVRLALQQSPGDILVFLPGMSEIRRAQRELENLPDNAVFPLHGDLDREAQELALNPNAKRKVILSTNVAETSLTIDGVTAVVDSGLVRQAGYSHWSGLPSLATRTISRASAIQRAGRAGRTAPGFCIRLYSRADFDGRAAFTVPEIQRSDLTQTALEVAVLGDALPWLEAPKADAWQAARKLLQRLGALSLRGSGGDGESATLTDLGLKLSHIPAHPRLGRLILAGQEFGCVEKATRLAALLSENALEKYDALAELERHAPHAMVDRTQQRFLEVAQAWKKTGKPAPFEYAVLMAFPDRVAKKRGKLPQLEFLMSMGGTAASQDHACLEGHEYFVVLDVAEKKGMRDLKSSVHVRSVVPIDPDWLLDLPDLKEEDELQWNANRRAVERVSRLRYGALVLSEQVAPPQSDRRTAEFLVDHAWPGLELDQMLASGEVGGVARRLQFLRKHREGFPVLDRSFLREILVESCVSATAVKQSDLPVGQLTELLWAGFPNDLRLQLDRLAPESVALARGRRVKVNYETDQSPWIESRLQDFFGLAQGPTVLQGQVPLTLHLLAPNRRAVQVTSDLAGFWKRAYAEVRQQLSRRYPRHAWPEDPSQLMKESDD